MAISKLPYSPHPGGATARSPGSRWYLPPGASYGAEKHCKMSVSPRFVGLLQLKGRQRTCVDSFRVARESALHLASANAHYTIPMPGYGLTRGGIGGRGPFGGGVPLVRTQNASVAGVRC